MKTKIFVIGMCVTLLTIGISAGFLTRLWESVPQKSISNDRDVPFFSASLGYEMLGSNISIHIAIPDEPSAVKIYNISNSYSKAWAENIVSSYYPTWDFKNYKVKEICNENSTFFQNGSESITITNTSVFMFYNKSAQKINDDAIKIYLDSIGEPNISLVQYNPITSSEAYNIAVDYISNHGGFPANYYLLKKSGSNIQYRGTNTTSNYFFCFNRKIDGMPIIGGEGIKIWVSGLGDVTDFIYQWREIANVDRIQKIASASTALNVLEQNIQPQNSFPQININVNGTNKTMNLYGIEVGYWTNSMFEMQSKMYPVWIFYLDAAKSRFICTDAIKPA